MKTIAARKVIDQRRAEGRLKRGGGRVLSVSTLRDHRNERAEWQNSPAREIPPELQVMAAEMFERVAILLTEEQREVFFLRMEGYSVQEIAVVIERSKPTVERRLRHIREIFREWIGQHDSDIQLA